MRELIRKGVDADSNDLQESNYGHCRRADISNHELENSTGDNLRRSKHLWESSHCLQMLCHLNTTFGLAYIVCLTGRQISDTVFEANHTTIVTKFKFTLL